MSAAPKRLLHEEEGQSKSGKRPHEDIDTEISNSLGNEQHHLPTEHNTSDRKAKIQRIDTSEVEKNSSLLPNQVPSPSIASSLDHSITSCNRLKLHGFRDDHHNRDAKVETSEKNVDYRELQIEIKLDPHVKREEHGVNVKEIRSENEPTVDFKADIKSANDSSTTANPHLIARETKEPCKAFKYSESSSGVSCQSWVTQHVLPIPVGKSKETPTSEGQEFLNAHREVAVNKIELDSEEKIREKERKKNDNKHIDWPEKNKDKQDHNTNLNLASSCKELLRDNKDAERWERKELNDMERDHTDKTSSNLNGRELDISSKMIAKENTTLDTKKSTDVDGGKISDKKNKNQKRNWDCVAETGRQEGKKETEERESEDGYTERVGVIERDRELSSPSVHQHKRLLRQKGTPQPSLR